MTQKKEVPVFLLEKLMHWGKEKIGENKLPLLAGIVAGLLAHMFVFTNKLVNHDEVGSLFIKGDTVSSGRWGLEIMSLFMPDYSMPWIYGIISIVLLTVSACVIVKVFGIRSGILRGLVPALIVTFPSMIGTFGYMFTSSSYAVSFLLAVLAVWFLNKTGAVNFAAACGCMIFSLSIYQSYVGVAASLLVLVVMRDLMDRQDIGTVIRSGVVYVLFLGGCMVVYLGLTKWIQNAMGIEMNEYAARNLKLQLSDLLPRVRDAYDGFFSFFRSGLHGLIPTVFSRRLHRMMGILLGVELLFWGISERKPGRILLMVFLLSVLPLSINCMYLLTGAEAVHTLVLYGFVSVYVLAAMVIDKRRGVCAKGAVVEGCRRLMMEAVAFTLAFVVVINTYVANEAYLNLHMRYETTYSFFSNVLAQVMADPDYDADTKLALIGNYQPSSTYQGRFSEISQIMGVAGVNPNSWSNYLFLARYMGYDIPFASRQSIQEVMETEEYAQMPVYPYHGSVGMIGDVMVVKLEQP